MPFVFQEHAVLEQYNFVLFLLCEELLYLIVRNDTLLKHVSAGLLLFDHLDALGEVLARAGLQCSDYFLCHGVLCYLISR